MKIDLRNLTDYHPKLRGNPIDYGRSGSFALQRATHRSPTTARIVENGNKSEAEILWQRVRVAAFKAADDVRITEDGAEAVALGYAHQSGGWTIKRRMRRGEYADWMLQTDKEWCAMEVSGVAEGKASPRLREKVAQVSRCTLPVAKLAVVIQFEDPQILAESA